MSGAPFFTLLLATCNRTATLPRLLDSLVAQSFQDFELIVVDQNADDRLLPILEAYAGKLPLRHLRHTPGLSAARNFGLRYAEGRYTCFPDDDCWMPADLLERIHNILSAKSFPDFLCFTAKDDAGLPILPFASGEGAVNLRSVWRQCCSITLACRTEMLLQNGGFHLQFGIGAKWPSGEDMELPVRLLREGYSGYYTSELSIFHPRAEDLPPAEQLARVRRYAPAAGRIWRIHQYSLWYVLCHLSRPLLGAAIAALQGDPATARCRLAAFKGRAAGWLSEEGDIPPDPIPRARKE